MYITREHDADDLNLLSDNALLYDAYVLSYETHLLYVVEKSSLYYLCQDIYLSLLNTKELLD